MFRIRASIYKGLNTTKHFGDLIKTKL